MRASIIDHERKQNKKGEPSLSASLTRGSWKPRSAQDAAIDDAPASKFDLKQALTRQSGSEIPIQVAGVPTNGYVLLMSTVGETKSVAGGLVVSNPGILGGTPVFRGTRLPVQALFDYLGDGLSLDYFLDTFEGVTREQAQMVLRYGWERIAEELAR